MNYGKNSAENAVATDVETTGFTGDFFGISFETQTAPTAIEEGVPTMNGEALTDEQILKLAQAVEDKRQNMQQLESFYEASWVEVRWGTDRNFGGDNGTGIRMRREDIRPTVEALLFPNGIPADAPKPPPKLTRAEQMWARKRGR